MGVREHSEETVNIAALHIQRLRSEHAYIMSGADAAVGEAELFERDLKDSLIRAHEDGQKRRCPHCQYGGWQTSQHFAAIEEIRLKMNEFGPETKAHTLEILELLHDLADTIVRKEALIWASVNDKLPVVSPLGMGEWM